MTSATTGQTARERRAALVAHESRELVRALYELDLTQREVAEAVGRASSKVQLWTDHERAELPNAADVACFPPTLREWYARRDAARASLCVSAAPDTQDGGHLRMMADVIREGGELAATYSEALADGHLSDDELRAIHREGLEVFEAALRVVNAAKEELRERSPLKVVQP